MRSIYIKTLYLTKLSSFPISDELVLLIAENGSFNLMFEPKVLLTCSSAIEGLNIQFLQNVTHIEVDL